MFDMEKKVDAAMKDALLRFKEKDTRLITNLRIQIQSEGEQYPPSYQLLDKTEKIRDLTLKEILNIGTVDVLSKEARVEQFLHEAIKRTSKEDNMDIALINFRIFTRVESGIPEIYLYKGDQPVKPLQTNDILN